MFLKVWNKVLQSLLNSLKSTMLMHIPIAIRVVTCIDLEVITIYHVERIAVTILKIMAAPEISIWSVIKSPLFLFESLRITYIYIASPIDFYSDCNCRCKVNYNFSNLFVSEILLHIFTF